MLFVHVRVCAYTSVLECVCGLCVCVCVCGISSSLRANAAS